MTQTIHWRQEERRKKMRSGTAVEKINKREAERLKGAGIANTKAFRTRQKFGPASSVRTISVEDYLSSRSDE